MNVNRYEIFNTFWDDFLIAEEFGERAIRDTYKRAFDEWKNDYKYLAELVMVLNCKIWKNHENHREIAKVYDELWQEADAYACDNLKGDELLYFLEITD